MELPTTEEIKEYVADFREFLQGGTFPERKALIRNFVEGIEVVGDEATLTYTVPMPDDSFLAGRATEKVALDASVLSTVHVALDASVLSTVHVSPPLPWLRIADRCTLSRSRWDDQRTNCERLTNAQLGRLFAVDLSHFDTLNEIDTNEHYLATHPHIAILSENLERLVEIMN